MLTSSRAASRSEWREYRLLVLASFVGFSFFSLMTYAMGLFLQPLATEFGWTRAQATAGLSLTALITIPLGPVVGAAIDRWGSRRLAILGMLLTSAALASFSLANGSMTQWLALWAFYAVVATCIKSTVWTTAVSGSFSAARGLALGLTMSGAAAAQVVTPPLTNWLIDTQGWRMAFVWLGFGWGGLGVLATLLFFRDRAERERAQSKSQAVAAGSSAAALPGLTFGEALRNTAILRIALSTFITIFLGIAFLVHQVPILTEAGVSRTTAAYLASLTGLAGVAGKLLTGMMADRWNAGVVGGVTLATPAIAFVMLLEPFRSPALIVAAMFIIGYSAGAKLQVTAYLTSRYAGMRHFGKIFAIIGSLMAVASGLGPVVAGALYDATGDYTALLVAGIPGSLLCGFLIMGLGPFPRWDAEAPAGGDGARGPDPEVLAPSAR